MIKKFETTEKERAEVIFASAAPYLGQKIDFDLLIYHGRKEVMIECKDKILLDKLKKVAKEDDTYFPRMTFIIKWLEDEGISYFIEKNEIRKGPNV